MYPNYAPPLLVTLVAGAQFARKNAQARPHDQLAAKRAARAAAALRGYYAEAGAYIRAHVTNCPDL